MWIIRKPSLKEAVPSENIAPQEGQHKVVQSQNLSLQSQVEQIARTIAHYTPLSELISMQTLLCSPCKEVKKFR